MACFVQIQTAARPFDPLLTFLCVPTTPKNLYGLAILRYIFWFLPVCMAFANFDASTQVAPYCSKYFAYLRYYCRIALLPFRKTRTCMHTPGYPPMVPEELTEANLFAALDGAGIVYFDVRLHETALLVAEEVNFSWRNISSSSRQPKKYECLNTKS